MDYKSWGEEYLQEASVLKARVNVLRCQLKTARSYEAKDLMQRISLLYTMYLECSSTGRLLLSFDKRGNKTHED